MSGDLSLGMRVVAEHSNGCRVVGTVTGCGSDGVTLAAPPLASQFLAYADGWLVDPDVTSVPPLLQDVYDWLAETYTPAGQRIWLRHWQQADPAKRERMARMARTPEMGT